MISQIRLPTDNGKMEARIRVNEHREAILTGQHRLTENLIAMGRRLLVVRAMLGPKKFPDWVGDNLDWTPAEARHLITIARRFNRPERDRVDAQAMLLLGDPKVPRRVARRALSYLRGGRHRRITLAIATRRIKADRVKIAVAKPAAGEAPAASHQGCEVGRAGGEFLAGPSALPPDVGRHGESAEPDGA